MKNIRFSSFTGASVIKLDAIGVQTSSNLDLEKYPAENCIDGDLSSMFRTDTVGTYPWISVELPDVKTIKLVKIHIDPTNTLGMMKGIMKIHVTNVLRPNRMSEGAPWRLEKALFAMLPEGIVTKGMSVLEFEGTGSGNYITLQQETGQINIMEFEVFEVIGEGLYIKLSDCDKIKCKMSALTETKTVESFETRILPMIYR